MMTQPIRTFKDLTSETAPAGGNDLTKHNLSYQDRRLLEQSARYARAELLANALGEAQLFRMSDRELADIGLCRGDITFAVREVAHGVAPEIDGEMRPVSAANQNMRRAA
jgi:uncharacterized protein YjiS (DUF1127 family)